MKRWAVIGLVVVMFLVFSTVSFAGGRDQGRLEGIVIGLGAVTLYNLIGHGVPSPVIPAGRAHERDVYHCPPPAAEPPGHWEIRREWVPEQRERVWIPGHDEDGYWVEGHYEVRIHPGYYLERRVWVEDECSRVTVVIQAAPRGHFVGGRKGVHRPVHLIRH